MHLRTFLVSLLTHFLCLLHFTYPGFAEELIPTNPPLKWWKGNLHTHSFWSDGDDFPEMIAEWYRTRDYNFLALSDHNILSEGNRWLKRDTIIKRGGIQAIEKYLNRFGKHWVEMRGVGSTQEIRLKPLNEFRALMETRGKFIMIASEEITDRVENKPVHLNATNLKQVIQPLSGKTVREAIEANLRAVAEQAKLAGREIIVHLNHPNYGYAVTADDLARAVSERFVEVYNGHPSIKHLGDKTHPSVEALWDIANTIRLARLNEPAIFGLATDDSHNYHGKPGSHPGRGWVMVRARHLTPESLIRSLKQGDFYASSGVNLSEIMYDSDKKQLALSIRAEPNTTYTTQFVGVRIEDSQTENKLTAKLGTIFATSKDHRPVYKLSGDELFVRAVVTSSRKHSDPSFTDQHQQAWTQPVGWRAYLQNATQPDSP